MTGIVDEKDFDDRLTRLERAHNWSPRVISKIESLLRTETEDSLFRINPVSFASERNIDEAEGIDLFLHATTAGLFNMNWQLLCPKCSCVVESFRSLQGVRNQFHCKLCQSDFEVFARRSHCGDLHGAPAGPRNHASSPRDALRA